MIGNTLALVRRALRVDVRDMRPHLFRAALAGVILWTLIMVQDNVLRVTAPGLMLFGWIAILNYWFITLAGATFFASAITEEKEERTLSLLKMANVGPLSILLGKWIPRLVGAALLICIQLPFTVLAITLGGILWHQIAAAYLALLAHLFLVGNLGLMASVVMSRTGGACGLSLVLILLYHILPHMIQEAIRWGVSGATQQNVPIDLSVGWQAVWDLCEGTIAMSGLGRLTETLATGFSSSLIGFQFISNMVVGAVFFGVAWLLFEPCTRNDVEPQAESTWMRRFRLLGRKSGAGRVWNAPLVWKDFQYIAGGGPMVLARFIGYGLLIIGSLWMFDSNVALDDFGSVAMAWSIWLLMIELPLMTTRLFRNEVTQKTWATLVLLPRSLPELAYPKLVGGGLALLPLLGWFTIGGLCAPDVVAKFLEEVFDNLQVFSVFSYFLLNVLLGIHVATWLSIAASWAIWPLAIFLSGFIVTMANMMLLSCLFLGARGSASETEAIFVILCLVMLGLNILVHVMIGRSLQAAAAE